MSKTVLFVGAHTDDEISTAGTLAKFVESGYDVCLAVFSFCEESCTDLGHHADILRGEFTQSRIALGIFLKNTFTYRYPVRHFPAYRQSILEDLVKLRNELSPFLVFAPNTVDPHQDHQVISEECRRAFPRSTLLGYESPKSLLPDRNLCYYKLSFQMLQTKVECLRCYKSQAVRPTMNESAKTSLAMLRGTQAGTAYAEAFEVIRLFL